MALSGNTKPRDKQYKLADREGLYVAVSVTGTISFRYKYRLNSRSETLTFGRYGADGITLAGARNLLQEAKKKIAAGQSPAQDKARSKGKLRAEKRFGVWAQEYLRGHEMAESTRDMRRSVYVRDLKPFFANRLLHEITEEDVRGRANIIVERGAPATDSLRGDRGVDGWGGHPEVTSAKRLVSDLAGAEGDGLNIVVIEPS